MTNPTMRLNEQEREVIRQFRKSGKLPPEKRVEVDREVNALKTNAAETKRQYNMALARLSEVQKLLADAIGIKEAIDSSARPEPVRIVGSGKGHESIANIVASDWHYEETVDPSTISDLNAFDLKVAQARIEALWPNSLKLIDMCRTKSTVDSVVLWLLGDLISGYIHPELAESNGLSPVEAIARLHGLICSGIDQLLKEGRFKKIIMPCSFGNHGRTTEKRRVSTAAQNSYEWLLYHFLAKWYANEKRVQFQIATGYHNYIQLFGFTYRGHHGDNIRYMGGVGDVDIPLNKAIAQWNKARKADVDVLGHWHSRKASRNFVINGSLIGYNAYSVAIKANYEPPTQSFFMVHPRWNKTVEAPIYLESQ